MTTVFLVTSAGASLRQTAREVPRADCRDDAERNTKQMDGLAGGVAGADFTFQPTIPPRRCSARSLRRNRPLQACAAAYRPLRNESRQAVAFASHEIRGCTYEGSRAAAGLCAQSRWATRAANKASCTLLVALAMVASCLVLRIVTSIAAGGRTPRAH
jgi:hypothetical protein